MKPASRPRSGSTAKKPRSAGLLRLGDIETRIRGMNIAAEAARHYLEQAGKTRAWPGRVARLVDANLSLMSQRIMIRVQKFERIGQAEQAERAFRDGMHKVGVATAKELLGKGS